MFYMYFRKGDMITAKTLNLMAWGVIVSFVLSSILIFAMIGHLHRIHVLEGAIKDLQLTHTNLSLEHYELKPQEDTFSPIRSVYNMNTPTGNWATVFVRDATGGVSELRIPYSIGNNILIGD